MRPFSWRMSGALQLCLSEVKAISAPFMSIVAAEKSLRTSQVNDFGKSSVRHIPQSMTPWMMTNQETLVRWK